MIFEEDQYVEVLVIKIGLEQILYFNSFESVKI